MLSREQLEEVKRDIEDDGNQLPFMFNALSDTGRYNIFRLLMNYNDLCVTDVANVLGISVPAASQQLKIMELSGLVNKERDGQMICYAISKNNPVVKSLVRLVAKKLENNKIN